MNTEKKNTLKQKHMTLEEANEIAKLMFGTHGFVRELRRFTGNEKPESYEDGWIRPEGEPYAYVVGYWRRGKRGAWLNTRKGYSTNNIREALDEAVANMTIRQYAIYMNRLKRQRSKKKA